MAGEIYAVSHSITGEKLFAGQTVLTYDIEYPQFVTFSSIAPLRRINMEYKERAAMLAQYAQVSIYEQAVTDFQNRQEEGFPFFPYEMTRPFTMTYGQDCIISLYLDEYIYTGGAHGNTIRTGDTWEARTATKLPLCCLFRPGVDYQERILGVVIAEAQRRAQEDSGLFLGEPAELVVQNFNPANFYLTPAGIVIFYQQYDLGPYSAGIQTFLVPYGAVGARVPGC